MEKTIAGLVEELPFRFVAGRTKLKSTRFRLTVGRLTRDIIASSERCEVEEPRGRPDVEIETTARTWRAIDSGKLSGIEAFAQRKLALRGSIEKALLFEPLFDRPDAGGFRYTIDRVSLGGIEMSALCGGDRSAPPLVLLHGLGANKASWLPVVPDLASRYRVIAVDLPGFGASSKPRGRYNAQWFSDHVVRFLEVMGLDSVFLAGNSLGGRIAMEVAMREPDRVAAIVCLCPAAAFTHRPALGFVRLLRPELGIGAFNLPRNAIKQNLRQLFADPGCIEEQWYDSAIDDFLAYWRSPRGRLAFLAALRNVYLDEPHGEEGFWSRLSQMKPPALFIYGRRDVLISARFATRIQRYLATARVVEWEDCGHVPQLEFPERTTKELVDFFSSVEAGVKAV